MSLADLKVTTREESGRWATSETRYAQGRNWRLERRAGPEQSLGLVLITNYDRGLFSQLDVAARQYKERRIPTAGARDQLAAFTKAGKTLTIRTETVDTGERQVLFGHEARHVLTRVREEPEPGGCEGGREYETDGWYIDLPRAVAEPFAPRRAVFRVVVDRHGGPNVLFCVDQHRLVQAGPEEKGFPVRLTTKTHLPSLGPDRAGRARTAVTRTEVTELSEAPLDPALFSAPKGFERVAYLPGEPRPSWTDGWKAIKRSLPSWFSTSAARP